MTDMIDIIEKRQEIILIIIIEKNITIQIIQKKNTINIKKITILGII